MLFIVLGAFIAAPFVDTDLFGLPPMTFTCGWQQFLAMATLLISWLVLSRLTTPFMQRFLIVTLMCYSTLLICILPVVDDYKSYGTAFRSAASEIKNNPELKVAGWNLDETTVAGFYYYCDFVFPQISDRKILDDILQGRNDRFNGAVTLIKNASPNDLPGKENQVIFTGRMGKRRLLQIIAAPTWDKDDKIKKAE